MKSLGQAAMDLLWLSPCAHSLLALARSPFVRAWPELRNDPGLVLLAARSLSGEAPSFLKQCSEARMLRAARRCIHETADVGFVDWSQPAPTIVYRACLRQAGLASALAQRVDRCDPQRAWVAGLLAPLGWLALCVRDPASVEQQLAKPAARLASQPNGKPFDSAAAARRLNRRWRLPAWLSTVTGHLGLTAELACRLGADVRLFQIVQLAVLLHQREAQSPYLAVGADIGELLVALQIGADQVEHIVHQPAPTPMIAWESPTNEPLLRDVLALALRDRQSRARERVNQLHRDVDRLHEALEARRDEERRRVQTLKLSSLAEFAAGAGHEINNPLAVISGQAQYLLQQLDAVDGPIEEIDDPTAYLANLRTQLAPSLQKIIGQSHRIHGILTDLMQFARPPAPKMQTVDVANAIEEATATLQVLADERQVRLVCSGAELHAAIHGDPIQVRASLTALLRNAIEAAPAGGWAGIRVEREDGTRWAILVEDSGPGPGPVAREHLFDPFFSGRAAGRGRGMGLPTAWRLACQQDGDVRFDGTRDGVTRFRLILPAAADTPAPAYANGRNGSAHHSE